ncbi:MAG: TonB-dependent receptor [Sphingomonadales bacterium]|nr:TonB-dependent receptor [Sphingomonadales bacterium]
MTMTVSTISRTVSCAVLLLGSCCWSALATAATPADNAASAESERDADEIIVTGSTREILALPSTAGSRLGLTPLETPASVSVIAGAQIRLRGDATINAAVTRAVGITTTATVGGAGNGVAARGFNGSSVAYIYDGIRNMGGLGNLAFPYDPWTVERVEVLNGPGSVLYGTGAIGGAINIVPRRPSETPEYNLRVSAGSFGTFREAIDATGPITEKLLYRFDVSQQNSNGYIDHGKSSSTAVSGALTFLPSDTLKITLSDDYGHIRPMNYNGLPLINGVALKSLRRENYGRTDDINVRFIENSARLNVEWSPGEDVSIRNISSFVYGDRIWRQGPTQLNYQPATNTILRGSYGEYVQKQRQWNNQTEIGWKHQLFGTDNSLSVGGDVEHLFFRRIVSTYAGTSVVSLTNPAPGLYPAVTPTATGQNMHIDRYALFVDDRLSLTSKLSIVGGLRYDRSNIHRDDAFSGVRVSRVYKPINARIGAVYDIASTFTAYAQYSKATDPISNVCCITAAQLSFDAAKGNQIEAGLKQSLWNGRLAWTLAVYRIKKNDLLIPDPVNPNTLIQVGAQSSKGIEATVALTVVDGVQIDANATVLKARYDEFRELVAGTLISRSGNRPTNVPQKSANLWVNWDATSRIKAQAGVRYVGNRFIDTANLISTPDYSVFDASLRYVVTDRLAVDVRAFNLTDKLYATTFIGNGRGGGQWQLGAPRSFEIAVTGQF